MEEKAILGTIFIILMTAVLFTPQNSNIWKIPFFFGLFFGVFWYFKK